MIISIPLAYFCAIGRASKEGILIKGSDFIDGKVIKAPEDIEKYIYKLKQLGVVSDWTVDFKTRSFDLLVGKLDYDSIKKCLQKNLRISL